MYDSQNRLASALRSPWSSRGFILLILAGLMLSMPIPVARAVGYTV